MQAKKKYKLRDYFDWSSIYTLTVNKIAVGTQSME